VLRECLDSGGSLDDAARRYEYVRKAFVTGIQSMARSAGMLAAWTSPWARAARDALMRVFSNVPPIRRRGLRIAAGYNPREQAYLRAASG
jgi:2-polyprenyl-6-methoxyphenol hydroxylase-like FAD-dependent oxidoreductase